MPTRSTNARFELLPTELLEDIGRYLLHPTEYVEPGISQTFYFTRKRAAVPDPVRYTPESVKDVVTYRSICHASQRATERLFGHIVEDTEFTLGEKSLESLRWAAQQPDLRHRVRTVHLRLSHESIKRSFPADELARNRRFGKFKMGEKSRITLQSTGEFRAQLLTEALAAFPELQSVQLSVPASGVHMSVNLSAQAEEMLVRLGVGCSVIREGIRALRKRPCVGESISVAIHPLDDGITEHEVETLLCYFPLAKSPERPTDVRAASRLSSREQTIPTFNNAWGIVNLLVRHYVHVGTLALAVDHFNNPAWELRSTVGHRSRLGFEGLVKQMEYWRCAPRARRVHLRGARAGALDMKRFLERVRMTATSLTFEDCRLVVGGWKFLLGYLSQWQLDELVVVEPRVIGEYAVTPWPVKFLVDGQWREELRYTGAGVAERCLATKVLYPIRNDSRDGLAPHEFADGTDTEDDDEDDLDQDTDNEYIVE